MDLLYPIALTFVRGMSSKSCRAVYNTFSQAEAFFRLSERELKQLFPHRAELIQSLKDPQTLRRAEEEMEFAMKHNIKILHFAEPEYPQRLNRPDCEDTPTILYYLGDADLNKPQVLSVVGTRHATQYGKSLTRKTIHEMSRVPMMIVSGLAYGIDTAAHQSALEAGLSTVGVLGHGLDQIYPHQNRGLATQMIEQGGGLLTEYPSKTQIQAAYFPARNRIIAALADGVLVAEASQKGGALITANLALGYHRDLMAFPGRVGDPYSQGCNRIIANNKALLVENGEDILYAMGWEAEGKEANQQLTLPINLSPDEEKLFHLLSQNEGLTIEEIKEKSGLSLPIIATALLNLELSGVCVCCPGKIYKLS